MSEVAKSTGKQSGSMEPSDSAASLSTKRRIPHNADLLDRIAQGKADPITPLQRALAAKLRVAHDKRFGIKTPEWIVELADSVDGPEFIDRRPPEVRPGFFARLRRAR